MVVASTMQGVNDNLKQTELNFFKTFGSKPSPARSKIIARANVLKMDGSLGSKFKVKIFPIRNPEISIPSNGGRLIRDNNSPDKYEMTKMTNKANIGPSGGNDASPRIAQRQPKVIIPIKTSVIELKIDSLIFLGNILLTFNGYKYQFSCA